MGNILNYRKYKPIMQYLYRKFLPARVNFEISKSSTLTHPFDNIYSRGSDMKRLRLWLFPAPEAATTIQKRFKHEGVVRK